MREDKLPVRLIIERIPDQIYEKRIGKITKSKVVNCQPSVACCQQLAACCQPPN